MKTKSTSFLALSTAFLAVSTAHAQPFAITWSSIDGGGTTAPSVGGSFTLAGTVGQPDAGSHAGGAFTCLGGFWAATGAGGSCYANCDGSTLAPILNVNDFSCFINAYAAASPYANCDASTSAPVLNVNDFSCFLNKYAAGCP